jgi:hypothetical protein
MIDTAEYNRTHSVVTSPSSGRATNHSMSDAFAFKPVPDRDSLFMLPAKIHGFDLQNLRWTELLVANIASVTWNKQMLDRIPLSATDRMLLQAIITYDPLECLGGRRSRNRRDYSILLLRGRPGYGKTYTAEAIADAVERPLYRVSCSDFSADIPKADEHLRIVVTHCSAWDCVILFEDADLFFHAMAPTFFRALESFHGIVILNTNSDREFNKSVTTRLQLVIRFEHWHDTDREWVWRNMINDLADSIGHDQVHELLNDVHNYARWQFNGWNIKSAIKMATQLASARGDPLMKEHLHIVLDNWQD